MTTAAGGLSREQKHVLANLLIQAAGDLICPPEEPTTLPEGMDRTAAAEQLELWLAPLIASRHDAFASLWSAVGEARADSRREESLSALVALVEACADHRQSMRVVGAHKLAHADPDVLEAAETQMRATRSALNGPLLRVQILMPGLADLADQAVKATFSMRDPSTDEQLEQRRLASLNLNSQLVAAARLHFGDNR
jgi:hypothetical protein